MVAAVAVRSCRLTSTGSYYDSPPKKPAVFFHGCFIQGCSTQGRILLKEKYPHIFLCAKVYRSRTSRYRVSEDNERELVSKPAISLEKSWGATVERLHLDRKRLTNCTRRGLRHTPGTQPQCVLSSREIRIQPGTKLCRHRPRNSRHVIT